MRKLSLLIAFSIGIILFAANAQTKQDYLLKFTQEILQERNNEVILSKDVNVLIGDSEEHIVVKPIWDSIYYDNMINDKLISLVVPLKNDSITSSLIVTQNCFNYTCIVSSQFMLSNDSIIEYVTINSNIKGETVGARIYQNDQIISEYYDDSKSIIFYKKVKPTKNTNRIKYGNRGRNWQSISDHRWEIYRRNKYGDYYRGNGYILPEMRKYRHKPEKTPKPH